MEDGGEKKLSLRTQFAVCAAHAHDIIERNSEYVAKNTTRCGS